MKKYYIYIVILSLLTASCSDDLGNYDYQKVNEVVVLLKKEYGTRKEQATFTIKPEIRQSMFKNQDHLKFEWYHNTTASYVKGTLVGESCNIDIKIDPEDKGFAYDNYLRLYVTDTVTNAKYLAHTTLKVVKPYQGAWMILHKEDGKTKLGAVEYIGTECIASDDAYFDNTGNNLQGEPVALGVCIYFNGTRAPVYQTGSLFYIFTDNDDESGIYRQDSKFKQYDQASRFIYPDHKASFSSRSVIMANGLDRGRTVVSNGQLFQGGNASTKMYRAPQSPAVTGAINITHGTNFGWTSLFFDKIGRRFLHFYYFSNKDNGQYTTFAPAVENKAVVDLVVKQQNNVSGINLDDIGTDKEMAYIGAGYYYGPTMIARQSRMAAYAVATNKNGKDTHVYEFHSYPMYTPGINTDPAPLTGYFTINTPPGMTTTTPMASSAAFNRLLFYATGNKVYKLDFGVLGGSATLIYQHPDANSDAKVMKVARKCISAVLKEPAMFEEYDYDTNRSFGVVFEKLNGTSDFVVLNLTSAGKVDKNGKYPSIQTYNNFGKIKDIEFL